jgi:hypothetical protein
VGAGIDLGSARRLRRADANRPHPEGKRWDRSNGFGTHARLDHRTPAKSVPFSTSAQRDAGINHPIGWIWTLGGFGLWPGALISWGEATGQTLTCAEKRENRRAGRRRSEWPRTSVTREARLGRLPEPSWRHHELTCLESTAEERCLGTGEERGCSRGSSPRLRGEQHRSWGGGATSSRVTVPRR